LYEEKEVEEHHESDWRSTTVTYDVYKNTTATYRFSAQNHPEASKQRTH
jgi:hypothetical protein